MLVRYARCLVFLPALAAAPARAQGSPAPSSPPSDTAPVQVAARTEIVMGVAGSLDPDARATLVRLLRAELEPQALSLAEDDPQGEARDWARDVTREERRLLAVLLDTRDASGWRLVLIDAARGRAISRELPRGERDAANVEAVVAIVLSATSALREGLEVASAPLDAVVGAPAPARAQPTPAPAPKKPVPSSEPPVERATTLHASLSALAASFAEDAEPTFGASLALGVSLASLVDVDVRGSRQLSTPIESVYGSFELTRTALALSAGPRLRFGATPREPGGGFSLVPSVGGAVEWLHRSETEPAADITSSAATTTPRVGALLELRGRAPLVLHRGNELFSLVGTVGGSYFGERVRFLAGDAVLAEARPTSFYGELGLFITSGPL